MEEEKGVAGAGLSLTDVKNYWEGKEVWVVLDPVDGLWRQAQCMCVVPPEKDHPTGKWTFIVDTKFDLYRHMVVLSAKDTQGRVYDHLKLADAGMLHDRDHVFRGWQSPAWFDILSVNAVSYQIKDGAVALHPYVSEEIIELRKLVQKLQTQVETLEHTVEIKTEENIFKSTEISRLESLLAAERMRFMQVERDLTEQVMIKERECSVLQETNAALVRELDELKHIVNQAQADNNVLRSRLQLMLDELVKLKALVVNLQLEVSEKTKQIAALDKQVADLTELLEAAHDRILNLEEKLRTLEIEHYKLVQEHAQCAIIRKSLQDEIERLRKRPLPAPIVVPQDSAQHDDSALLELLRQYESQYDNIWRIIYETLLGLAERVAALEARIDWPSKQVGPVDEPQATGEEGVVEARRLASQLGGEVDTLQGRIEELENFLNTRPPTPPPVVIPQLKRSPDLTMELLRELIQLVKFMKVRQEELFVKMDKHKPEYVATYRQLVSAGIRKTQYDGDFPWLMTKKLHALENENKSLRNQHELTKGQHYELVNRTDAAFAPIVKENKELREKIDKYRDDLVMVYRRLGEQNEALKKAREGQGFVPAITGALGVDNPF